MEASGQAVVEWKFLSPSGRGNVWASVFGGHGRPAHLKHGPVSVGGGVKEHGENTVELLLQTRKLE